MNTMLEPRMVAKRTQRPHADSVSAETLDWIASSSHGGLAALAMLHLLMKAIRTIKVGMHSGKILSWDALRENTDGTAEFP
jgi:hypothetical protein